MKKIFIILILFVIPLAIFGQSFTILHSFTEGGINSDWYGSITIHNDTIYGITPRGGYANEGTLYRICLDGTGYSVLYNFSGGNFSGRHPIGCLCFIGDTIYGVTTDGGSADLGLIYKIQSDGSDFTILHTFDFGTNDCKYPYGGLITDNDTLLYGMTLQGGEYNNGTIYRINIDGTGFSLLHSFEGSGDDGEAPDGELVIQDTMLYGTAENNGFYGYGIIFKISVNGNGYSVMHSFGGITGEGLYPEDRLILIDSTLFGVTSNGGLSNVGTIYKIKTDGSGFSTIYNFDTTNNKSYDPEGGLIYLNSSLYGTTNFGGSLNYGTIFRVDTNGINYALLHSFRGAPIDGSHTISSIINKDTILYGTTYSGGSYNFGTVFTFHEVKPSISLTSLSTTIICPDNSLEINYTKTGLFYLGNKYTAQLSDSTDNFSNPINIGFIVDTTSGKITVTIPTNVVPGSNYIIRIISSNPRDTSVNTLPVNIYNKPTVFNLSGSGTICEGDEGEQIILSSSEIDVSYQLIYNSINSGNSVNGTGNRLYFGYYNQGGKYYVKATSTTTGCSSLSDSITITVNPKPIPNILHDSPLIFCEGDSVILTSSLTLSNYDLTWSTGQKIQRIIVKTSGKIILTVRDKKTGCGDTVSVQVTVNKNPLAQITVIGNKTICYKDSVILQTNIVAGNQYLWSTGETTSQIIVNTAGKYKLTVTNQNNCSSSDSVTINVISPINLSSNKLNIDFGDLDPCASQKIDSVIITNNGGQSATIVNIESDNDAFTAISPLSPINIESLNNINLKIKFSKSKVGSYIGNIKLISVCGDTFSIIVSGNRAKPSVSSAVSLLDFGTGCVENSITKDTILTIYNDADTDAVFQIPLLNSPFSILTPNFPQTINAKDSLKVTIRYKPIIEGIYDSVVTFPYRIGTCPDNTMDVSLVAKYLNIQLNTKDTLFSFTPFCQCDISKDTSFYVKNIGNYKLTLTGIQTDNNSDNLTQGLPITLNVNDSVKINLRFKPQGNDSITSKVIIKYEDCGKQLEISLAGRRIGTGFNPSDTINFGEFIQCRDSVLTQILHISNTNCSGNIARITGVSISTDAFSTNIQPNDTLPNNGVNNYQISYSPKNTNDTIAILTIDYEPCSLTKQIILKGKISNPELTSTNINFGNVEGGQSITKTLTIKNIGNTRLTIDSISAINSQFSIEPPQPQFPLDINAGDSLVLSIKYSPSGEETDSLNVIVYSSKPCSIRANPVLYGTGTVSHFTAKTVVYIMADSAAAGESINLPLMLESSENLIKSGINSFIARISLNKTILKPINLTPNGTLNSNDTRQIEITGNWKQGVWQDTVGKLADIEFIAALGDVECTPLKLDTIIWIGGASNVTKNDGEFCLTGLCKEGGSARLVNTDYTLILHQSKPNPAKDNIEIDFEVIEQGRTKLFIINAIGDIVATIYDGYLSAGQYSINYNLTTFPDGVYMYVLQTPSDILCKKLELIK